MIDIEVDGDVRIVHWRDGENRVNLASLARWHEVVDELAAVEGPLAVVVEGEGKNFSQGLDLDAMAAAPETAGEVVTSLHLLFGRMLRFPAYVVGALNGHAFAAGAMLACCFDVRVMRADRGYWCLPEVDLGLPLTGPMFATVETRLPRAALIESSITGRRYGGPEALAAGIVEHTAAQDEVLARAVDLARPMAAKDRRVIAEHKRLLFGATAATCGWEPPAPA